jgi:hypothetical protein
MRNFIGLVAVLRYLKGFWTCLVFCFEGFDCRGFFLRGISSFEGIDLAVQTSLGNPYFEKFDISEAGFHIGG